MGPHADAEPKPVTGSTLGAGALLLSLLGASGCLVITLLTVALNLPEAFFGLPVTAVLSLTGFALGVIAFFRAKENTPRGGAITATFLGGIAGATQGAAVVGTLIQFLPIQAQVIPLAQTLIASDDPAQVEQSMSEAALQEIDGQTMLDFFDRIEVSTGGPVTPTIEWNTIVRTGRMMTDYAPRPDSSPNELTLAKTIELLYDPDQRMFLSIWLDEEAVNKDKQVLIDDMVAFLPTGELLILRNNGPASDFAGNFNAMVLTP